jgi:predicted Na+-dependent transporter
MTFVWTILGALVLIIWVLSLVDVFRRHYPAWTTVGYVALIVILPFIGSMIYWWVRKPSRDEVEQAYRAQADSTRAAAARSFDRTGPA